MGVKVPPGRSALNRGMLRLDQRYVRRFNKRIVRKLLRKRCGIVVDSTGIRLRLRSAWYDIRIGRRNRRRDNVKLHLAVELRRHAVVEYRITKWGRNDPRYLGFLLRDLKEVLRVMADAGYLSRKNCDIVVEKNGKPFFCLKRNTMVKPGGSSVWKRMVQLAMMCKEIYDAIYHTRSVIEAVNSAIKRGYGNNVCTIRIKARNTMIAPRLLAYNIKQLFYDRAARSLGVPFWIKCDRWTTVSGHSNVVDTLSHGRATGFYHSWML